MEFKVSCHVYPSKLNLTDTRKWTLFIHFTNLAIAMYSLITFIWMVTPVLSDRLYPGPRGFLLPRRDKRLSLLFLSLCGSSRRKPLAPRVDRLGLEVFYVEFTFDIEKVQGPLRGMYNIYKLPSLLRSLMCWVSKTLARVLHTTAGHVPWIRLGGCRCHAEETDAPSCLDMKTL